MNRYAQQSSLESGTTSNVGTADRAIRILAGLVLLGLVLVPEGNARWWGLAGVVPLATGLAAWCPLYEPFGIDTSRR